MTEQEKTAVTDEVTTEKEFNNQNSENEYITKNVFGTLSKIKTKDHVQEKNGFSYLPWAWAWGIVKDKFPEAFSTVYENDQGWTYHTDGKTCWVKVGVTICGVEHRELYPIMDYRNKSIPVEAVASTDINKAIQRGVTKAISRHGLGLDLYVKEDLMFVEPPKTITKAMVKELQVYFEDNDIDPEILKLWKIEKFEDITEDRFDQFMNKEYLDGLKKHSERIREERNEENSDGGK